MKLIFYISMWFLVGTAFSLWAFAGIAESMAFCPNLLTMFLLLFWFIYLSERTPWYQIMRLIARFVNEN